MVAKISDIIRVIEAIAPAGTAMKGDNVGLMLGSPNAKAERVLAAVDVNLDTVRQAIAYGCDLIVAHHPLFYDPITTLREDAPEGRVVAEAIRGGLGVFCAHTNFDVCPIGTSATLAALCGARDIETEGFAAFGDITLTTAEALGAALAGDIDSPYLNVYGGDKGVERVMFCGGSCNGAQEYAAALASGADAVVCGEMKYHQICRYIESGVSVVICGHRESEAPAVGRLLRHLQNDESLLQYDIRYYFAGSGYVLPGKG